MKIESRTTHSQKMLALYTCNAFLKRGQADFFTICKKIGLSPFLFPRFRKIVCFLILMAGMFCYLATSTLACDPTAGPCVESGNARFEQAENALTVYTDNNTVIDFGSLSTQAGQGIKVIQGIGDPFQDSFQLSATSKALFRDVGGSPTVYAGWLEANGILFLENVNGIHFTPTANILVNNLIASTLAIDLKNFRENNYVFEKSNQAALAQILNEGAIHADKNVAMIAGAVSNQGVIIAKAGSVQLASGNKTTVSFDRMGIINVEVNEQTTGKVIDLKTGKDVRDQIENKAGVNAGSGLIQGTHVAMTAKTAEDLFENAVNQDGIVKATGMVEENGVIRIRANRNIEVGGTLDAGQGGIVEVISEESVTVAEPLMTQGDTSIEANKDVNVKADITTQASDLSLIADRDLDGVGSFHQDKGTTIRTVESGDITIQSSGASELANIDSAGSLTLRKGGAPADYTIHEGSVINVKNDMVIGSNVTVHANNSDQQVGRDWRNAGYFDGGLSTVSLVSNNEAMVLGDNRFHNFKIEVPGKLVKFGSDDTQEITGTLTLRGEYGNLLKLDSTDPNIPWKITALGEANVIYVLLRNSIQARGPPIKALHTSSLGNNINWDLDPFWTGQGLTALWSDPDNWDTGTVPTAFDIVTFDGITGLNPNKDSFVDPDFQGTLQSLTLNGYTGTLTLGRDLTISGDWTYRTGTFDPGTYAVIFNDAGQTSHINGNATFYNLTCLTPGKRLVFEAGSLTKVTGTLTIEGAQGNPIILESSVPAVGSEFGIDIHAVSDAQGNPYLEHLEVRNSIAYGPLLPIPAEDIYKVNATDWDANIYWIGELDSSWKDVNNWATTSGGTTHPGAVPGSSDIAIFDSGSVACNIDDTVNVAGFQITSGYSGIITQTSNYTITIGSSNYDQAGGTFTGGSGNIDLNGTFTLSGGAFTTTSGTMYINSTFTHTVGGTFTAIAGTVVFDGSSGLIDVNSTETFANLQFNHTSTNLTISDNDTLIITGTLTLTSGRLYTSGGILQAEGDVVVGPSFGSVGGYYGNITIKFAGGAAQNFTMGATPTADFRHPVLVAKTVGTTVTCGTAGSNMDLNGSLTLTSGIFQATSGTMYLSAYYTNNGGTFTANGGTVVFDGSSSPIVDVNVTETFANLQFNNTSTNLTIVDTLISTGTLTLTSGRLFTSTGGTLQAEGNVVVGPSFGIVDGYTGNVALKFAGGAAQDFDMGATPTTTFYHAITVAKDASTAVTLLNNASTKASITVTTGILNLAGYDLTTTSTLSVADTLKLTGANSSITTPTLNGGSTVEYTGTTYSGNIQNWTYTNATLKINGHGGVFQLSGAKTFAAVNVLDGTLDLNGQQMSVTGSFDVTDTLKLQGGETAVGGGALPTPTLNAGSTVEYSATSGTRTIKDWTYQNLKINGSGGTFNLGAGKTIAGTTTVSAGIFGLLGSATFNDTVSISSGATLKNVVAGSTVTIKSGKTINNAGSLILVGTTASHLIITADAASVFNLNSTGGTTINECTVDYLNSTGNYVYPINSTNGGTNTGNITFLDPTIENQRYWIATTDSNWNATANWSATSGGAGGASVPTGNNTAIFDGQGTGNCTLDTNVSVDGGLYMIGTVKTLTQDDHTLSSNSTMYFNSGTFAGSNVGSSISVYSTFIISGGSFTSTSGTLTGDGDFTRNGGTFNANGGTVRLRAASGSGNLTTGGITFNHLTINRDNTHVTIALVDDLDVDGNLTLGLGSGYRGNLTISATRNITIAGDLTIHSSTTLGTNGQTLTVTLNGTNQTISNSSGTIYAGIVIASSGTTKLGGNFAGTTQSITVNSGSIFDTSSDGGTTSCNLTGVTTFTNNGTFYARAGTHSLGAISQAGASASFAGGSASITADSVTLSNGAFASTSGTLTLNGNFNKSGGTFDANGGTILFNNTADITTGGATFNHVNFSHNRTFNILDDMDIDGDLYIGYGSYDNIIVPSGVRNINLKGNFTLVGSSSVFGSGAGTLTLTLDGVNQNVTRYSGTFSSNLVVANSGTASLASAFTVTGKTTTINEGATFDLAGYQFTSASGFTLNGTLKLQGGESVTTPGTFGVNSTVDYTGATNVTVKDWSYQNLKVSGSAVFTLGAGKSIAGTTTVTAGTLLLAGSATFNDTVSISSGATLKDVTAGATVTIKAGKTITNAGSLILVGTSASHIAITADAASVFNLNSTGGTTINEATVNYLNSTGNYVYALGSTDGTTNTGNITFLSPTGTQHYWIGSASSNWNDTNNWSHTSGGATGAGVPTTTDVAIFDGNSAVNCTIDATVNVKGLYEIGYVKTISQGAYALTVGTDDAYFNSGTFTGGTLAINASDAFTVSGGTFNSTSATLTITNAFTQSSGAFNGLNGTVDFSGAFTLSGGAFTATTGTTYFGASFTHTAGGTFEANGGTAVFDTLGSYAIDVNSTETFDNLTINYSTPYWPLSITAGDTLFVDGALNLTRGVVNGGTIQANADVTVGANWGSSGTGTTALTFGRADGGTQNFSMGASPTAYFYMPVTINAPGSTVDCGINNLDMNGSLTLADGIFKSTSATLYLSGNYSNTGGTFNANGGTIVFDCPDVTDRTINNDSGTETFNNVQFNHGYGNSGFGYSLTGDTVIVTGTLTLTKGDVDNGTLQPKSHVSVGSSFRGGTAVIEFTGDAANQNFSMDAIPTSTFSSPVVINKDAGTKVTCTSNIDLNGNFEIKSGEFVAPAALYLGGITSFTHTVGGTFTHNDGTVYFDSPYQTSITVMDVNSTETFHDVQIDLYYGNSYSANLSGDTMVVSGDLLLGKATLNSGTIQAQGAVSIGSSFRGGTVVIEFTGAAANQNFSMDAVPTAAFTSPVIINKDAGTKVTCTSNIDINGNFEIKSGEFVAPALFYLGGNYTNSGGSYNPNGGTIIFDYPYTGNQTIDISDGSETFNNVQFNHAYAGSFSTSLSNDTIIVTGDLTLTKATLNSGTLQVEGNVSVENTFYSGTATLTMSGTNAQLYTDNGGADLALTIDKDSNTVTLGATFSSAKSVAVTDGILNLAGYGLTLTAGTFSVTDTLQLQGNETITLPGGVNPTLNAGSTVDYTGATNQNMKDWSYQNLKVSGSAVFTLGAGKSIAGTTQVTAGTLLLAGSATFNDTVSISSGATLKNVTAGATVTVKAGKTINNAGSLILVGTTASHLILTADAASVFNLNSTNATTINEVTVSYLNSTGNYVYPINSTNSTGNTGNITFLDPTIANQRYWIAASDSNWNATANWSTTSGGAGGASVPGSNDTAIFDGLGAGNCTIDATVNVKGFYMIGTVKTVSQEDHTITIGTDDAYFNSGTFTGSNNNSSIDINDVFTLSGAAFTSTNGTLTAKSTFTKSSGTFVHNSGTVIFSHSDTSPTITTGGITFNNVTLISNDYWGSYATTFADSFTIAGDLTVQTGAGSSEKTHTWSSTSAVTIDLQGNFSMTKGTTGLTFGNNNLTLSMSGNGKTLTQSGGTFSPEFTIPNLAVIQLASNFTISSLNFNINSGGTFDLSPDNGVTVYTPTITKNFTNAGAIDSRTGTIIFSHTDVAYTITTGGITFNNVTLISYDYYASSTTTFADSFAIAGDLTVQTGAGNSAKTHTWSSTSAITIDLQGNFSMTKGTTGLTFGNSNLTLSMSGNGKTLTQSGGTFSPEFTIPNLAVIQLASNFTISSLNFNINNGGSFDVSPDSGTTVYTLTVNKNFTNAGTFYPRTGTVIFSHTDTSYVITAGGITFNNMTLTSDDYYGSYTTTFADSFAIAGNLAVQTGASGGLTHTWSSTIPVTINLQGNFSMTKGTPNLTFGNANLTLSMSGSGKTLTQSGGTFSSTLTIVNGASVSLTSAFTVSSRTTTIDLGGTLDLAGYQFTSATGFVNNGTLKLQGNETVTTPTLNNGSTVEYTGTATGGSPDYTLKDWTYRNLIINGGTTSRFWLGATETIAEDLTIREGILDLNNQGLTVTGTFKVENGGTFALDGDETPSVPTLEAGSTVEYNDVGVTRAIKDWTYTNATIKINGAGSTYTLPGGKIVAGINVAAGALDTNSSSLTVNGTTNIASGAFFNLDTSTLTIAGTLTNNGTLTLEGNSAITGSGGVRTFTGDGTGDDIDYNGFSVTLTNIDYDPDVSLDETGDAIVLGDANCLFDAISIGVGGVASTFNAGAYNFAASGDFTNTATGVFTSTGTVTFDGASNQTLTPGGVNGDHDFENLTHTGAGDLILGGNLVVNGTLAQNNASSDIDPSASNYSITTNDLTLTDGTINAMGRTGTWTINNDVTITSGTLTAPTTIDVAGDWANTGDFEHNSGTVNFTGVAAAIISGDTTFNNLSCAVAGKTLNFAANSEQEVAGDFTITGEADDLITLDRDGGAGSDQWKIKILPGGSSDVSYVDVSNSNATGQAITPLNSISTGGNNTNWSFGKDFSGKVYLDHGVTAAGAGLTVAISVNGAAAAKTAETNADGNYSLTSVEVDDGDVITIYLDGEVIQGTVVTIVANENTAGLDIYANTVTVRDDYPAGVGYITNANLATGDNGDSDILYSVTDGALTVDSGMTLYVWPGDTFRPCGDVTVANLIVDGTLNMTGGVLNVSGSISGSGTYSIPLLIVHEGGSLSDPYVIPPGTVEAVIEANGMNEMVSVNVITNGAHVTLLGNPPGFVYINGQLQSQLGQAAIRQMLTHGFSAMFQMPTLSWIGIDFSTPEYTFRRHPLLFQ